MKSHIPQTRWTAALASIVLLLAICSAPAQSGGTYTWDQHAQGQLYMTCPGPVTFNYYWPSNNNWTQSYQTNSGCGGVGTVESAPSNWDPTPPVGLYPGGVYHGVDIVLDDSGPQHGPFLGASVFVGSVTVQPGAVLTGIGSGAVLTADWFYFQADGTFPASRGGAMAIGPGDSLEGGLMQKSGGANSLFLNAPFYGSNATFEVDSGTMIFPTGFGGVNLVGGTFAVSSNATLTLTADSGATPMLAGNFTGVGGGTVLFNNGALAGGWSFNLPGNMFQWTGGSMKGAFTNSGVINITNYAPQLYRGIIYNNNLINLADNSSLDFFSPGGAGPAVYNEATSTFNIQGNSSLTTGSGAFYNYGLLLKSAGAGASQITPFFNNYGGTVEVDAGTMALNGIYITNATFVVSNGATLDLATVGGNFEIEGTLSGSGGGTVLMNNGTVFSYYPATLNFPGSMFQWAGGKLGGYAYSGYQPLTNAGTINVSGSVVLYGTIANNGAMIQSGSGSIGSGNYLFNEANGIYDIQNDNGIALSTVYNYGLIRKSAGTNTSVISGNFINYGPNATVEVDTGTLALANPGGNYFTNTTLVVSNGATLDLNTANVLSDFTDFEGYVNGSGGGTLLMTNGGVYCNSGATMNFPGAMFQWLGGQIGNTATSSPLLTNSGTLNIGGSVRINGYLANSGTMIQTGSGAITGGSGLKNTGVYEFQNDNGISVNSYFDNHGLLAKTSGTGVSTIAAPFNNYGAVQAASGTILFANVFNQDAGTLQINPGITFGSGNYFNLNGGTVSGVGTLGYTGSYPVILNGGVLAPGNPFGTIYVPSGNINLNSGAVLNIVLGGPSQFSQLAVKNTIQYGGTLNVTLTNGYTPAIGTKFQIITNGNSGYSFASVNVPHGISVTYSNTGVYLTVTSAVPPQVVSPQVSGGNFGFTFGTVNGQSYTVQQNSNLTTTNWTFYTNITGNGSLYQFLTPVTNVPQLFFRVREP